jgi:hypothetical protein
LTEMLLIGFDPYHPCLIFESRFPRHSQTYVAERFTRTGSGCCVIRRMKWMATVFLYNLT